MIKADYSFFGSFNYFKRAYKNVKKKYNKFVLFEENEISNKENQIKYFMTSLFSSAFGRYSGRGRPPTVCIILHSNEATVFTQGFFGFLDDFQGIICDFVTEPVEFPEDLRVNADKIGYSGNMQAMGYTVDQVENHVHIIFLPPHFFLLFKDLRRRPGADHDAFPREAGGRRAGEGDCA